jgi:hypothetical protein
MKAIFFLTAILFGSITLTCAQDSTRVPIRQGDPTLRQTTDEIRQDNLKDMVEVNAEEIPAELNRVIQKQEYRGEKKTYYKHKEKDEYAVEVHSGEVTYFYLFDKNGKPIYRQN